MGVRLQNLLEEVLTEEASDNNDADDSIADPEYVHVNS